MPSERKAQRVPAVGTCHTVNLARARICEGLRSPGIYYKESIPPAYVAWRAGTKNLQFDPWNRFLGSLNVYKFGFWSVSYKNIGILEVFEYREYVYVSKKYFHFS